MNVALLQYAAGIGTLATAWAAGWLAFVFFFVGAGTSFFTSFLGTWDTEERIWHIGFQLGSAGILTVLALMSLIPGTKIFLGLLLGYVLVGALFLYSLSEETEDKKHE